MIFLEWTKKYDVSNIDTVMATNGTTMYVTVKFSNGDSCEFIQEVNPNFFDEMSGEVYKHLSIKDRRKKVIGLKNKMK